MPFVSGARGAAMARLSQLLMRDVLTPFKKEFQPGIPERYPPGAPNPSRLSRTMA